MVKIRPFRVMLWSLLLIAAGGALIIYGTRVRESNRVTYSEMIEGMADLSQNRATQDNPPVLEIWDMGWLIMTLGVIVAIPGSILMLTSIVTMVFHRLVPDKHPETLQDDEDQEESNASKLFDSHGNEKAQREALDDDDDEDEVGEELLHRRIEIKSSIRPSPSVTHVLEHEPQSIEPIDLVEPDHARSPIVLESDTAYPDSVQNSVTDSSEPSTYDIQDGHDQNPAERR